MGWNENPVAPSVVAMNIALKGKLMYERGDILQFLKMLHSGLFPPRGEVRGYKGFGDGGLGGGDGCWGAAGGNWEVQYVVIAP